MTFRDKIAKLMGGMSYEEAAAKTGIPHDKIWRWVKKGQKAAIMDVNAFAEAFKVPLIYLACDEIETVPGPPKLSENRQTIEDLIRLLGEEESILRLKGFVPTMRAGGSTDSKLHLMGAANG